MTSGSSARVCYFARRNLDQWMGVGLQFLYYAKPVAAVFALLTNRGQWILARLWGWGWCEGAAMPELITILLMAAMQRARLNPAPSLVAMQPSRPSLLMFWVEVAESGAGVVAGEVPLDLPLVVASLYADSLSDLGRQR
jgi:hypothetical protein